MKDITPILKNKDYYSILRSIWNDDNTSMLISDRLGIKKSNLSHKLKYMRDANLIKHGEKNSKYRIEPIIIQWDSLTSLFLDFLRMRVNNSKFKKELTDMKQKLNDLTPVIKKIIEGFFEYGENLFCFYDLFELLVEKDLDLLQEESMKNPFIAKLVSIAWICSTKQTIEYRTVRGEIFGIYPDHPKENSK